MPFPRNRFDTSDDRYAMDKDTGEIIDKETTEPVNGEALSTSGRLNPFVGVAKSSNTSTASTARVAGGNLIISRADKTGMPSAADMLVSSRLQQAAPVCPEGCWEDWVAGGCVCPTPEDQGVQVASIMPQLPTWLWLLILAGVGYGGYKWYTGRTQNPFDRTGKWRPKTAFEELTESGFSVAPKHVRVDGSIEPGARVRRRYTQKYVGTYRGYNQKTGVLRIDWDRDGHLSKKNPLVPAGLPGLWMIYGDIARRSFTEVLKHPGKDHIDIAMAIGEEPWEVQTTLENLEHEGVVYQAGGKWYKS